MTFITTLKFTALHDVRLSPLERRRTKLIQNLKDQLNLFNDPSYAKSKIKWTKDGDDKHRVERFIPVRPWWHELPDGKIALVVKSGLKKIEFKKGQTAILVESRDALPKLITGLLDAVQNGELDTLLIPPEEKQVMPQKKAA